MTISLTPEGLTAADVVAVARGGENLELSERSRVAIEATSAVIEGVLARGEVVYGVTTGFGALADTVIPAARSAELQVALIRSHAAGMGDPMEPEVVRAMMSLRARSLAMGYSGVRPLVVETLVAVLNAGITPVVPAHGSVGASGDLAPLAHCALTLIGEGRVIDGAGTTVPAAEALSRAGITPLTLRAKEGLALVNGTDGMLGMLVLALDDLARLAPTADITAAMSVEALMGTDRVFAADLTALRPQPGQQTSAANLRRMLAGSAIVAAHRHGDDRVQDAYSLRCTPAVHGAVRDAADHARRTAAHELRSAIDNPMILPDGRVESCGNFHGAPLAHAADLLAVATADLGAIAERRTDRILDPHRSHGLPPFLAHDPGVDSGMMIAHYTQAAMVAENRRRSTPASVDTMTTSAMQEDHVSLGWAGLRRLRTMIGDLERILAVEAVIGARGIELRGHDPAPATAAVISALRREVPGMGPDRVQAPELEAAHRLVADGSLLAAAETVTGELP